MADPIPVEKPKTEEELLTLAGINILAVSANEGQLTDGQVALLMNTHGPAITTLYLEGQKIKREQAKKEDEKRRGAQEEYLKEIFRGTSVKDVKAAFEDMRAWGKANMSPEDFQELQRMSVQGGRAQKAALKELADLYMKENPQTYPLDLVNGDGAAPKFTDDYIDRWKYLDEVQKLEKERVPRSDKRFKALEARRTRSRAQEGN